MTWIILAGCVVGVWGVLTIITAERRRRIEQIEREAQIAAETAREAAEVIPEV